MSFSYPAPCLRAFWLGASVALTTSAQAATAPNPVALNRVGAVAAGISSERDHAVIDSAGVERRPLVASGGQWRVPISEWRLAVIATDAAKEEKR